MLQSMGSQSKHDLGDWTINKKSQRRTGTVCGTPKYVRSQGWKSLLWSREIGFVSLRTDSSSLNFAIYYVNGISLQWSDLRQRWTPRVYNILCMIGGRVGMWSGSVTERMLITEAREIKNCILSTLNLKYLQDWQLNMNLNFRKR